MALYVVRMAEGETALLPAPVYETLLEQKSPLELLGLIPAVGPGDLGSAGFCRRHGLSCAYLGGAMANGISSEEMVIAMGRSGLLSFFGSGGLHPQRVEKAILRIQKELGERPFGFNLLHNPLEPSIEEATVEL